MSRYDSLRRLRHQAADVYVDVVATIKSPQHGCGCGANVTVAGGVFLFNRSRSEQGTPGRIRDIVSRFQPDIGTVDSSLRTPRVEVKPDRVLAGMPQLAPISKTAPLLTCSPMTRWLN